MQPQPPEWPWYYIGLYFFLGGIAGGAYVTATIADLFGSARDWVVIKVGYLVAFVAILFAPVLLILDLGRPERFYNMFTRVFKVLSPMSVGSYALLLFGAFCTLAAAWALAEDGMLGRWLGDDSAFVKLLKRVPHQLLGVVGSFFGFFIASYTGVLVTATAQPFWFNNPLWGALFLASGASTAIATIALVIVLSKARVTHGTMARLKLADNWALILELVLIVATIAVLGNQAAPLLRGGLAVVFWLGVVGVGLVVPLALQFRAGFQGARAPANLTMLTALLILVGGFLLRYAILAAGQEAVVLAAVR